jgi:hypothetical protein
VVITSVRSTVPLFGPLVVLEAAAISMLTQLTNPAFITAITALVVAVVGLLKLFGVGATVAKVEVNTNSTLTGLQQRIEHLEGTQATRAEIAARPDALP